MFLTGGRVPIHEENQIVYLLKEVGVYLHILQMDCVTIEALPERLVWRNPRVKAQSDCENDSGGGGTFPESVLAV
jgi:hypothetical protein